MWHEEAASALWLWKYGQDQPAQKYHLHPQPNLMPTGSPRTGLPIAKANAKYAYSHTNRTCVTYAYTFTYRLPPAPAGGGARSLLTRAGSASRGAQRAAPPRPVRRQAAGGISITKAVQRHFALPRFGVTLPHGCMPACPRVGSQWSVAALHQHLRHREPHRATATHLRTAPATSLGVPAVAGA